MISKEDLLDGIAECQGVRNPNFSVCQKLAALLTIYHYMYDEKEIPETNSYSYAPASGNTAEGTVTYYSDTEFSKIIDGKYAADVWEVMDELMTVLQAIQPRLYEGTLRKLREM